MRYASTVAVADVLARLKSIYMYRCGFVVANRQICSVACSGVRRIPARVERLLSLDARSEARRGQRDITLPTALDQSSLASLRSSSNMYETLPVLRAEHLHATKNRTPLAGRRSVAKRERTRILRFSRNTTSQHSAMSLRTDNDRSASELLANTRSHTKQARGTSTFFQTTSVVANLNMMRKMRKFSLLRPNSALKESIVHVESGQPQSGMINSWVWCLSPIFCGFSTAFSDLSGNHIFMSAFWSWFIAQIAKLFTSSYRDGKWDYKVMFDSGGMPSSHTALVVGLTTSIAHQYGLGSVYFPLSLAFTLIVMYDAAGVRRHAGKQAEVLNKIVEDLFHGSAISDKKLKEVLGHSPLQVICGAFLGVFVGTVYMLRYSRC